jgi:hypothetical protein
MIQKQEKAEEGKRLGQQRLDEQISASGQKRKYLGLGPEALGVLIAIALATAIRVAVIGLGWQTTNSDEDTMGLMALHIAYRGEFPVFFYGQNYMGALEAYIGALLFHLLGPSLFSLRLGLVFLFDLFLLVMYLLARLLYTKRLAFATIFLLCFGSTETFTRQIKAVGGALETMLFGSLMLLLASWLVLSYSRGDDLPVDKRRRYAAYTALGLAIGLGLWSHMLAIPLVFITLLLLVLFCRSELRTRSVIALLLAGFFVGLLPLIVYNVEFPLQNSLVTLWQLHSDGGLGPAAQISHTFADQVLGTLLVGIPMATGASPLCTASTVPGAWRQQIPCMLSHLQAFWGVGFVLLWALATFLAVRELRGWRQEYTSSSSSEERRSVVMRTAHLMILAGAGLTLLSYVSSPAPALVPITSTRYLVGLLIAFPAVFWPLWRSARTAQSVSLHLATLTNILKRGILLFVAVIFLFGTFSVFARAPLDRAVTQQQYTMVNDLLRLHITRIYADYWTCDRTIFQSNEQIICSVINADLKPGLNRYSPYRSIVEGDLQAAYLWPLDSPQLTAFEQSIGRSGKHYEHFTLGNYIVYLPGAPPGNS